MHRRHSGHRMTNTRHSPQVALHALLAAILLFACVLCRAEDRLNLIRQRGSITIGVKTDYPPFGMLLPSGESAGFEHDLAIDIARRLHVSLKKVGVTGANRLEQLNDGRIDLALATIGDTAERREIATLIEPNYYSSGVTIMTPPDSRLSSWSDLRGQTVCATQGSYFNRMLATRYMLDLQLYNNGRDAKLAVRDRRCVGWIFDSTAIAGDLLHDEWVGYKTPLPPQWSTPWAIALARSEKGRGLEYAVADIVVEWHRSGFLIELEKKWHLPPNEFLRQQHELWLERDAANDFLCRRGEDGNWPVPCRNPIFVTSAEVGGLHQWGLYIKEKAGIDLTFVYDDYERRQFLHGLGITLLLTVCCVLVSAGCGIGFAILADAGLPALSALVRGFSIFNRMTPPLLQMYVLLFGVGSVLYAHWGVKFPPLLVAVICLSCYTGSTIMHILLGAADSLRLSDPSFRLTRRTVQRAFHLASLPISAALINVSKASLLASAIAVPDLLSVATATIAEHGNGGTVMNIVLLVYIGIVYSLILLLRRRIEAARVL
jgi:polar amino acid transport system substrate-binding protein